MPTRFEKARFHIDYGPPSLFERVLFKMKNVTQLNITGSHFNFRTENRNIPDFVLKKVECFSYDEWALVSCEVRADKGKFVNSTWETIFQGNRYWITIGFNNLVETIVKKDSSGESKIVKSGELYNYVSSVNAELMREEKTNV